MKLFLQITVILLLILGFSSAIYSADDADSAEVRVYTDASAARMGRAENRTRQTVVKLTDFIKSESLKTPGGGMATAVMVDASVKKALDELLFEKDFAIVEQSVFRRMAADGQELYGFTWDRYGFEIIFAFERTSASIMAEIDKVYGHDAYLYGELKRSYDDNYTLTIFHAEDLFDKAERRIDYLEAMISATVIGSRFQPLLGIHDGLGVLDSLGLASAHVDLLYNDEYVDYRQYEFGEDRIYSFLDSIESMQGDFVDNLFHSINSITQKQPDDGDIILPEEFFDRRSGDNSDYALLYYDLLKRMGYQVRFIVIDPEDGELYSTVFFLEKGTNLWGSIDSNNLEREKATKWQRLPALVFSASVNYFEPDIDLLLSRGFIELPPPSQWSLSPY